MAKRDEQMRLDIHPDPNRLDECWVGQVRLRLAYGLERAEARKALAQAKTDLAVAKSELDVTKAELEVTARKSPEKFGIEKVTEGSVSAAVMNSSEYQEARDRMFDLQRRIDGFQHEVDVLDAALDAIDDRKHSLQDLVRLYLADYYGTPKAPEGAKERMDDVEKRSLRKGRRPEGDRG